MAEPLPVYALSVRQPYAMAIVNGWKTVENRSWRPARPLRLLIHADVTFDRHGAAFIPTLGTELPPATPRPAATAAHPRRRHFRPARRRVHRQPGHRAAAGIRARRDHRDGAGRRVHH